MGTCRFCGKIDGTISEILQVCRKCILEGDWSKVKPHIFSVHEQVRTIVNLPKEPPKAEKPNIKLKCNYCINECSLSDHDVSYCGLRNIQRERTGDLPLPSKSKGYIHGYIDPNPTNCCNAWFCPAGTSAGFPQYSDYEGSEFGTYSYAAFLYGCTFDCLFCQNSSHKQFSKRNLFSAEALANQIVSNKDITCICYFGGTPEAQLPFSINLSNKILEKIKKENKERKFRVCWEWNGSGNKKLIEKCMQIALTTGGNIKFDLKSFNEKLNLALCGVNNERTLENFKFLAENYFGRRSSDMPELSACTLLVPGYTNSEEVELIAKFISSINKNIPYSLLIFHGDYQMRDLRITPRNQVLECLKVARKYLKRVNLGNKFLLGLT
ncbi:MAG: radical SAM protein [Candidatus Lokiarchaeota archaeon]|nr:radical SAM protein [Candidatus Lokiarchaeota archaeon]